MDTAQRNYLYMSVSPTHYIDWRLTSAVPLVFVSIVIIITSLILGFSPFVRSFLSLVLGVSWMWFVTTTRLYDLWFLSRQDSGALTRKRIMISRRWKEEARRKYLERQDEKQQRLEAAELKKAKQKQKKTTQGEVAEAFVRSRRPDSNV
jgi:hypothetical protein